MRWGILGPGRIARAFLTGLAGSATETGVPRAYGSYEELLADAEVDAVYVVLPNSLHAEWSKAAARVGKHVLCEKPLGRAAAEVEAMFETARAHGVWLMEAFMYRFHPRTLALAELVARGDIGEVRLLRSSFGFTVTDTANVRLSAELAGGALMDVGCYAVNAARMLAGRPSRVSAVARWTPDGVDDARRHAGAWWPGVSGLQQPPRPHPGGRHRRGRGRAAGLHPAAGPAGRAGRHPGGPRRRTDGDRLRAGEPVHRGPRASPASSRPATRTRPACRRCRRRSRWTTPPRSRPCC